jgi:hypothetical protein
MRRPFVLLALFATAAAAAPAGERLALPALPGFGIVHQQSANGNSIEEQVPRGETIQQWTRMVTSLRFGGLASQTTPDAALDRLAAGVAGSCPGAVATPTRSLTVSGRAAAEIRADCPLNPQTGLPETFFARAIAGASDLHMVQVAFRRVPSEADKAWAEGIVRQVALAP